MSTKDVHTIGLAIVKLPVDASLLGPLLQLFDLRPSQGRVVVLILVSNLHHLGVRVADEGHLY